MPPAAFSALAIARSIPSRSINDGTKSRIALRAGRPTTSPRIKTRIANPLLCVVNSAHFANDRDFYLTRVGHFTFDLLSNLTGHSRRLIIGYEIMLHHDPDLSPCLNRIRLLHASEGINDPLKFL